MISLLLDTHDRDLNIVLYKDGKLLDNIKNKDTKNHSEICIPLLERILEKNNITVHNLNEIIACIGPGSFTGIRLGVTISKTLAYTLNIPIKTITSIEMSYNPSIKEEYLLQEEKNGYYGAKNNNGELKDYFYLTKGEFNNWKNNHSYVITNDINLDIIPNIIKNKKAQNPHSIKPLYIKKIEVEKWFLRHVLMI